MLLSHSHFLTHSIDSQRLIKDIASLTSDCIYLKSILRSKWTRPVEEEQRRHIRARRQVTELLILLAASRNRLHIIHAPRELRDQPSFDAAATWDAKSYNVTIAMRLLPDYAVAPAVEEDQAQTASAQ